jgi:hypothetical protein
VFEENFWIPSLPKDEIALKLDGVADINTQIFLQDGRYHSPAIQLN